MSAINIQIKKVLYGNNAIKKAINTSFNEVFNQTPDTSIDELFELYNQLFFKIPLDGDTSHTTIYRQSLEYLNDYYDPKDDQIEALVDRILDLEEKLDTKDNPEEEISAFPNGTFLKQQSSATIWYMDLGKKRGIVGYDFFRMLAQGQGFSKDTPDEDIYILVPGDVISSIPNSTNISAENFND